MAYRDSKIGDWWYKKCKTSKICDWIDDKIIYYLIDKPKDKYYSIRHWFKCNWNKQHYRLVKQAFVSYGWDFGYLTQLEELQIDKALYWFEHHQIMVDEEYEQIMRTLRWAKHCIHYINDDFDLYTFTGDLKSVPVEKDPETGKLVDSDNQDAELHRLDFKDHKYHYLGPKVNTRNAKRFLNPEFVESKYFQEGNGLSELYVAKCRHLYYKIREQYTELWWD